MGLIVGKSNAIEPINSMGKNVVPNYNQIFHLGHNHITTTPKGKNRNKSKRVIISEKTSVFGVIL